MDDSAQFPLVIGNVLLCEDVRSEANGKYSALGIYSGDMLVQSFGGALRMALYLELTAKKPGPARCEVNLSFNNVLLASAKAEFDFVKVTDPAILVFPMFPLPLSGPGTLSVDVICDGATMNGIKKEVRQADLNALYPSASARPSSQSPTSRKKKVKQL